MAARGKKAAAAGEGRTPNTERGEIALKLEGEMLVLRPTYEAIEAFEASTGKGMLQLAREAVTGTLRVAEMAQIAAECVRAWGRATENRSAQGVNATRIAELILESDEGVHGAMRTIGAVLALASTGGYTAKGEPKAGTTTSAVPAGDGAE